MRHFWPLVFLLLLCMASVEFFSARQENATFDEALHLAAGFSYLKTGDYRMDVDHPPLAKYLAAFPLLFLNLKLPVDDPSWAKHDSFAFADQFLYHNRLPADTILLISRSSSMLVSLCLGLAIALWTRKEFGAPAALLALLFYAFEPTVISHARYTTTDTLVGVFSFMACLAWESFLRHRKTSALMSASVLLGLALVSKFSAVFLLPAFAILYVIFGWRDRTLFTERAILKSAATLAATAFLIVAISYAPQAGKLLPVFDDQPSASLEMLRDVDTSTILGRTLAWAGREFGLQKHPFLDGLNIQAEHNARGHSTYLLGRISNFGHWYYFPVAFAVKTPVATLAALLLALSLAIRFRRNLDLRLAVLAVPVLVYLAFCIPANINIGIRHILPIYPFLFVLAGVILATQNWRWKQATLGVIAVALAVESLAIYPHYLAFFNVLAGGPGNGPRYLVDSNLDWGQDLKNLKLYMDAHQLPSVCLSYFGSAEPEYYGIRSESDPANQDCVAAVSATLLYGAYVPGDTYAWLRARTPVAKIGYSIYVYDLRKTASPPPP